MVEIKQEANESLNLEDRVFSICNGADQGTSIANLLACLPTINSQDIVKSLNRLLAMGQIDLVKKGDEIFYKVKAQSTASTCVDISKEEKLILQLIESSGSAGIWNRDLRAKSNLSILQVNKILRSLENRQLIKELKGGSKKKMYVIFDVEGEPAGEQSPWLNLDGEVENEFVRVVTEQCYSYLRSKLEQSKQKSDLAPLARKLASAANCAEMLKFIVQLGISKIELSETEIQQILDLLVYDGKVERFYDADVLYRVSPSYLPVSALLRTPCGKCPVAKDCHENGVISPKTCIYMDNWLL